MKIKIVIAIRLVVYILFCREGNIGFLFEDKSAVRRGE